MDNAESSVELYWRFGAEIWRFEEFLGIDIWDQGLAELEESLVYILMAGSPENFGIYMLRLRYSWLIKESENNNYYPVTIYLYNI